MEQKRRNIVSQLEAKRDQLYALLNVKRDKITISNLRIKKTIGVLQFVSIILEIILVAYIIYLGSQIITATSKTVKETIKIQNDISYQIHVGDKETDEFKIVYNTLNSMAYDLNDNILQLQESKGKINAMLQSISDHMFMINDDLTIIWANDTAESEFGKGIVGKKCWEIFFMKGAPLRAGKSPE